MDIEGGFLLVALSCLLATMTLSADGAFAYGVVPPLGLGRIIQLRVAEASTRGKRVTLVGGAAVAIVAQLLMIASVVDAYATKDAQRMTIAAVELASAVAWLVLLWQRYRSRPAS